MSLEIKATYNENTDFEFKVSDTLENLIANNQITDAVLSDYCYTGFIDDMVGSLVQYEPWVEGTNTNEYCKEHCGVYFSNNSKVPNSVIVNRDLCTNRDTVYMRNVLLYNAFNSGNVFNKTTSRIVLDIKDIKKWYMDFDRCPAIRTDTVTSDGTYAAPNCFSGTVYRYDNSTSWGATIEPDINDDDGITKSLHPANLLIINGELFIGFINPSCNYRHTTDTSFNGYSVSYIQDNYYGHPDIWNWIRSNDYIYTASENRYIGYPPISAEYAYPTVNDTDGARQSYILCDNDVVVKIPFRVSDDYYTGTNAQFYSGYAAKTKRTILHWLSWCGLKFKSENTMYKPIIEGGIITGFTSDMDLPSEFDNMTNVTGNNIPSVAPSGGGNGDELVEMPSRGQFYGSGITTYYVNVPTAKLKTALGNWDNIQTGKDVLKNLISYKLFCFPTSTFTNGMLHDFVIAGTTLKDENDNNIQSAQLTQYGAVSLPSITIPKTFNDFRDYAPYTNLSMYIPLCGWFTLPPWCMGRTISGEMYINGYTGTLKCIVRADGNVVTELGGNASIDLPFAAEAVGMKAAAVLGNLINTAGSIASIANPSAGGVANVGTAVLGTVCALNANYTESKGTMGDGSNIAGLYHVYIKISRPATVDNNGNSLITIPTEYKRQYGLPCNKSLTLTPGDGYTQILDANITGNMTAREKQMIIDGFRRGLIL